MKNGRQAFHPDLFECQLETRVLPAGFVWMPMPFQPISPANNSIVMPGFSSASGGATGAFGVNPGANAYYLMMGINTNIYGLVGQASVVIPSGYALSLGSFIAYGAGSTGGVSLTVGSGANASGQSAPASAPISGYGASFNSGYSTSLNTANNYGMTTSPVGSVPVNTYSGENSAPDPSNPPAPTPAPVIEIPLMPGPAGPSIPAPGPVPVIQ